MLFYFIIFFGVNDKFKSNENKPLYTLIKLRNYYQK